MASSGCLEHHHNFHQLLSRRASVSSPENFIDKIMYQNDSPIVLPEETLFKKFLPNNTNDDEDADPYAADQFRIYEFKIRKCTRSRSHDWTDCPFAHPGEKARRRCPRRYNYSATVCPDFRRGNCSRGDLCEFAHGVFECWLHPSRYRTEACKDGKNCERKICFFAHTQRQLRVVSVDHTELTTPMKKYQVTDTCSHCCERCRCHLDIHYTNSPTSTLDYLTDIDHINLLTSPVSPPFSPARSGAGRFSPISRFGERLARRDSFLGDMTSSIQKEAMNELLMRNQSLNEVMRSMEMMAVEEHDQFLQFDLSSLSPCGSDLDRRFTSTSTDQLNWQNVQNGSSVNGPDFGWVNDLLT